MRCLLLILFQVTLCFSAVLAQSKKELKQHGDKILSPYADLDKPGISGAIIQDGEILYLEAFGSKNLDEGTALSTDSRFNIGAMSKQFTSLAFLELIEQGAVSPDDNVSTYLSWLPAYEYDIKIKHVLNHSSGLNDYYTAEVFSGAAPDDVITHADVKALISSQKALGCRPGSCFSLSNSDTESFLMAEIIEHVSDTSFEAFMKLNVFDKLGLNQTEFLRDPNFRLDDAAKTYDSNMDFKIEKTNNRYLVGPSNLYTSAHDLAKWYSYFSKKGKTANHKMVQRLDKPVQNESGQPYVSTWGEMTLGRSFMHAERGIPKYWQYGLIGGYGTNVFRFPEQDLTSFAMGNNDQYNGASAMDMVSPIMEDIYTNPAMVDFDLIATVSVPTSQLEKYVGKYYNSPLGMAREMIVRDDTLRYLRPGAEMDLIPLAENVFQGRVPSDDVIIFTFSGEGDDRTYTYSSGGSDPDMFEFYNQIEYASEDLLSFEGTYINEAMGQIYNVSVSDHELSVSHQGLGEFSLLPVSQDVFYSSIPILGSWTFEKEAGRIVGISVKSWGIGSLKFRKVVGASHSNF